MFSWWWSVYINLSIFEQMGWEPSKARNDHLSSIPKDSTPINVDVIYCQAWGGYNEALQAEKAIRTVFPNAQVNKTSPGVTGNLQINYNGETLFDKKGGDGAFSRGRSVELINRLKFKVANGWLQTQRQRTIKWRFFGKL